MYQLSFFNQFAIVLSLLTTTGIALHDTKVDKAFISTVEAPIIAKSEISQTDIARTNELHTHVERTSFSQAMQDMQGGSPRINARDDIKKHVTPKNVTRGHHAFDNYNLPIV